MLFRYFSNTNAQQPDSLYQKIKQMDSLLFDASNKCDTVASKTFFTNDLEFYHDKGGLTGYDENMRSIRKRCSASYTVRRELVQGTEVFPLLKTMVPFRWVVAGFTSGTRARKSSWMALSGLCMYGKMKMDRGK